MKTLNVYLGTTSGGKRDLMTAFGQGAEKHGIKVDYIIEQTYKPSDYAFIFAYKSDGVNSPNHNFRQEVVDKKTDKQIFFIDSNVLKYYEKDTRYFRLPYRSIHPHEADYFRANESTFNRVDKVKQEMNLEMKPIRKNGDHIVISLNRGFGGFSTFGKPCYEWAKEVISNLRFYTDRKIIIRSHNHAKDTPELAEDKKNLEHILKTFKNVTHTAFGQTDLKDDLKNAWACIVYTSTSGAVALMEGVPVFTTHPACFYRLFNAGSLSDIENPILVNRDMFLTQYVNAHWSLDDMSSGLFWDKFKRYHYDFSVSNG